MANSTASAVLLFSSKKIFSTQLRLNSSKVNISVLKGIECPWIGIEKGLRLFADNRKFFLRRRYSSSFNSNQNSFSSSSGSGSDSSAADSNSKARMIIGFTCKVCSKRSFKQMSKLAYERGVVIIKCDGCTNLHLIADHLGWFDSQKNMGTIQDILREKGEDVTRLGLNDYIANNDHGANPESGTVSDEKSALEKDMLEILPILKDVDRK